MKTFLRKRGYREEHVNRQFEKVDRQNREDLLRYRKKENPKSTRVPFTITYNKHLPNLHKILRDRLKTLHKSDNMKQIFPEAPMVAFRRDTNVQYIENTIDYLANVKTSHDPAPETVHCVNTC